MTRDTQYLETPVEDGHEGSVLLMAGVGHVVVPSEVDYDDLQIKGVAMNVAVAVTQLGEAAVGTIGPGTRIENGEITAEQVEEYAQRVLSGEFDEEVGELGPNAAGGTFTLVVADALTQQRFYKPGMKADAHSKEVYSWLFENADTPENRLVIPRQCIDGRGVVDGQSPSQSLIGDHGPDCGAQVSFEKILPFMAENAAALRTACLNKGIAVSDALQVQIETNLQMLLASGYAVSGPQLQKAFIEIAGSESLPALEGPHIEVLGRENTVPGKTLNRQKARAAFPGLDLDAFNIDAWAFEPAAEVIAVTNSQAETHALRVAMQYHNTATALVLCDRSLLLGRTEL